MNQKNSLYNIVVLLLGIMLILFSNSCSTKDENTTEPKYDSDLVGQWELSKMSWSSQSETGSYSQTQLDSLGIIWNLNFSSDNTAEQITNFSGPLTTQTGTWLNSGNELTLELKAPTTDEVGTMVYNYVVENNLLKLNWILPAGIEFNSEFTKQ